MTSSVCTYLGILHVHNHGFLCCQLLVKTTFQLNQILAFKPFQLINILCSLPWLIKVFIGWFYLIDPKLHSASA